MTKDEIQERDEGLELAKRMAEEEEGIGRRPGGYSQYVIPVVCVVAWSIFQLSIASWLILDSTFIRAIHLGFALLVVYLNYPLFKKTRFGLKYFSATDRIPILDYLIGIVACVFHLANGIWTMGITWGIWISPNAQRHASYVCGAGGLVLLLVGLSALVATKTIDVDKAITAGISRITETTAPIPKFC